MDPQHPVVFITGTGVPGQRMADISHPVLRYVGRFAVLNIPYGGIVPHHVSYPPLRDKIREILKGMPRATIAGYSQAGLHEKHFAMEHPDLVRRAVSIYTPWNGVDETVAAVAHWFEEQLGRIHVLPAVAKALLHHGESGVEDALHHFTPGLHDLVYKGPDVQALRTEIASNWPESVSAMLVSGSGDRLVRPRRSALSLEFPPGTSVSKKYLARKRPESLPKDVEHVRTFWSGHITSLVGIALLRLLLQRPSEYQPAGEITAAV